MTATAREVTAGAGGGARGRAVVCVSDNVVKAPVAHALDQRGFDVVAEVDRGIEALPVVAEYEPDVVVLDVALLGTLGVRLLSLITTLVSDVEIIVLGTLGTLNLAVLEAGARAVVPVEDLRAFSEAVSELPARRPAPREGAS